MARTVRLDQLRDDVRLWADIRTSGPASAHVTDAELTRLINLKLAELHELLISAQGADYPATLTDSTITTVSGTATYNLPADFMSLRACWIQYGDHDVEELRNLASNAEVPDTSRWTWGRGVRKFFRVRGTTLELFPTPNEVRTVKIRYTPAFSDLVNDSDTYDGVNGWEKMVTMGVALEVLMLQNRPNALLEKQYAEQYARIQSMASERQAQDPLFIRDTERYIWPWPHPTDRWTS